MSKQKCNELNKVSLPPVNLGALTIGPSLLDTKTEPIKEYLIYDPMIYTHIIKSIDRNGGGFGIILKDQVRLTLDNDEIIANIPGEVPGIKINKALFDRLINISKIKFHDFAWAFQQMSFGRWVYFYPKQPLQKGRTHSEYTIADNQFVEKWKHDDEEMKTTMSSLPTDLILSNRWYR